MTPSSSRSKAGSRRAQYSASTRRALVDTAEELFTENGYSATSLDSIVAATRVTKGALYHHFGGKQDLFEAVFERVESRTSKQITKALRAEKDPWLKAQAGLRAFLAAVQTPQYRRLVMQEGPAVMGYARFREQEERSTFGIVGEIVRTVLSNRWTAVDEEMVDTFTQIFFGAMSAAGTSVAESDDPAAASARVEVAIGFLLAGLRTAIESDEPMPTTDDVEPIEDDADEPAPRKRKKRKGRRSSTSRTHEATDADDASDDGEPADEASPGDPESAPGDRGDSDSPEDSADTPAESPE